MLVTAWRQIYMLTNTLLYRGTFLILIMLHALIRQKDFIHGASAILPEKVKEQRVVILHPNFVGKIVYQSFTS